MVILFKSQYKVDEFLQLNPTIWFGWYCHNIDQIMFGMGIAWGWQILSYFAILLGKWCLLYNVPLCHFRFMGKLYVGHLNGVCRFRFGLMRNLVQSCVKKHVVVNISQLWTRIFTVFWGEIGMVYFVDLYMAFLGVLWWLRGRFCVVKSLISLYWSLGRGPHYMTPVRYLNHG